MKKVFLLMVAGSITLASNAQLAQKSSIVFNGGGYNNSVATPGLNKSNHKVDFSAGARRANAEKTTVGGSRWFSYGYQVEQINFGTGNYSFAWLPLWNDTTAICAYSDGSHSFNEWTSDGFVLDPMYSGFSDPTLYSPSDIVVSGTDGYTIDSIIVYGEYMTSATGTPGDKLKIGMVYGDGTGTTNLPGYYFHGMTNYGVDTLNFLEMMHDSLNNTAGSNTGVSTAPVITNITLNDTFSSAYAFAVSSFSVPPGNAVGMAVSYHNTTQVPGPLTYPTNDTLQHFDGTLGYNAFYSAVVYKWDGASPSFPTYSTTDWNTGMFKREGANDAGWGGYYIPNWAWTSGGGASALQYPLYDFHITCPTCNTIGIKNVNRSKISRVKAYPVPANDELNITFNNVNGGNATVTLTDLVGKVVATQELQNVTDAKATFNTSNLAAGVYVCNIVTSDGQQNTSKVSVAH